MGHASSLTSCSERYRNHKTHAMRPFHLLPAVVSPIGSTTTAGGLTSSTFRVEMALSQKWLEPKMADSELIDHLHHVSLHTRSTTSTIELNPPQKTTSPHTLAAKRQNSQTYRYSLEFTINRSFALSKRSRRKDSNDSFHETFRKRSCVVTEKRIQLRLVQMTLLDLQNKENVTISLDVHLPEEKTVFDNEPCTSTVT